MAEEHSDLYTVEEREGPTNRPGPNRKSLSQLQTDKIVASAERREKLVREHRKALDEVAKLTGWKPAPRMVLKVRPAAQYSINGVNSESGGKIIGEVEVERTGWIIRRIRDGSLEVVSETEAPEDVEEVAAEGEPQPQNGQPISNGPRRHRRGQPEEQQSEQPPAEPIV